MLPELKGTKLLLTIYKVHLIPGCRPEWWDRWWRIWIFNQCGLLRLLWTHGLLKLLFWQCLKFKVEAAELILQLVCRTCSVMCVAMLQVGWWLSVLITSPPRQVFFVIWILQRVLLLYVTRVLPVWTGSPCSVLQPEPPVLPYLNTILRLPTWVHLPSSPPEASFSVRLEKPAQDNRCTALLLQLIILHVQNETAWVYHVEY